MRLVIFLFAMLAVFTEEYRLTDYGIVFGLVTVGFSGLFDTLFLLLVPYTTLTGSIRFSWLTSALVLASSCALALQFENTSAACKSLLSIGGTHCILFTLNLSSTIAALQTGLSLVLLPSQKFEEEDREKGLPKIQQILCMLSCTGMVMAMSIYMDIAIVNVYQVTGYFVAAGALGIKGAVPLQVMRSRCTCKRQKFLSTWRTYFGIPRSNAKDASEYGLLPLAEEVETGSATLYQSFDAEHSTQKARAKTIVGALLCMLMVASWATALVGILSSSPVPLFQHFDASLDLDYAPSSILDIVISMYDEPFEKILETVHLVTSISSIGSSQPRLYFYAKDSQTDVKQLQDHFPSAIIQLLPNVGREGQTYLYHMISHWDDLANHTVFLQAETHNPREMVPRIRDYFGADTGMLSLSFSGSTCNWDSCGDRFWQDPSGIVQSTYQRANGNRTTDRILLSYKGQFIASAGRIRGIDRKVYEDLHELFIDETAFVHHEPYLQGRKDDMSAPRFGFTMERMWSALLQCSDMDVAIKCPSLLSRNRVGGSRADCQCLDRIEQEPA